jgi:DAK2 domain fusion protein YloV
MGKFSITTEELAKCFLAGAKNIESKKDYINELNVFPVPDGDTGTNMTMTIMSAAKDIEGLTQSDMKTICKAMSQGSLRGARGNSGVILSQLLRGFTKVVKELDSLDVHSLAEGFQNATATAYKAVQVPKEGTILTVAKAAADKAVEASEITQDINEFADMVVTAAEETLQMTPEMLPVLKEAGVVDSGGEGLCAILSGARDYLAGKEIDLSISAGEGESEKSSESKLVENPGLEYSVKLKIKNPTVFTDKDKADFVSYLETFSREIFISMAEDGIALTLSTNDPGHVLTRSLKIGPVFSVSIINEKEDSKKDTSRVKVEKTSDDYVKQYGSFDKAEKPENSKKKSENVKEEPKNIGFVAVSIGKGMNALFKELGADYIIEGGQTMNPSAGDILKAVEEVNARSVFVLPNNKNIILAANQAKELCEDKELVVIPTKTLPQGIAALINFIPEHDSRENAKLMMKEITNVHSGEITYAVRDTTINDKVIHKGDYMGIGDEGILSVNPDIEIAMLDLVRAISTEDSSLVSVYYGKDVKKKDLNRITEALKKEFPDMEFEIRDGGQPVYHYVISVE